MPVSKVSCPHCSTALNIPVPLSEDAAFLCPRCQLSFRVQVQIAVAAASGAAPSARHQSSELVRPECPRVANVTQVTSMEPGPAHVRGPVHINRGVRLALVLGGFGLLLILG